MACVSEDRKERSASMGERAENGEERIILDDGKYVNISFASSGQQDTLWVTNLLFYYLVPGISRIFGG